MSKDKKKKSEGEKPTYEEALKNVETLKAKKQAAFAAREKFAKDNGLAPKKDHSAHEKHGKKFAPLYDAWKEAKEEFEAAEQIAKELKPKNERASKYEYPADVVTADQKKKHRAKMRAAAKAKAKAEAKGEEAPKDKKKKDKGTDAPAEAATEVSSKKKKKKNKDKASKED